MAKKNKKRGHGLTPERLAELRRATIIASAAASARLAGGKLTNEEVEKIYNDISPKK